LPLPGSGIYEPLPADHHPGMSGKKYPKKEAAPQIEALLF
jgi:hypothetical protein